MRFLIKSAVALGSIVGARQAAKLLRNIDLDDALGYVGLERRHNNAVSAVALVALSAAVGAGAALLLAPTSGAELRSRLNDRLQDAKSKLSNMSSSETRQFADIGS